MSPTINVLGMRRSALECLFADLGHQPYRARQLMQWVYHFDAQDFSSISVFSKDLRRQLNAMCGVQMPRVRESHRSHDGTMRWVLESSSGDAIETVLIPDGRRMTLCISSQAGCALDCAFCATGKQGFSGNLTTSDIVGQVCFVHNWLRNEGKGNALTNVVFMGMGEPLMNFDACIDAADIFMDDYAFGLSKRRVTISTSGVVPNINAMVGKTESSLAVSLHAANDPLRDELVPLNKKYPLKQLYHACQSYLKSLDARRNVTFEYTLLDGVNDSLTHAEELASYVRGLRAKINLIPFNPFPRSQFRRPSMDRIKAFQHALMDMGLMATLRTTRGDDINAACGQLVGQIKDRTQRKSRYQTRYLRSMTVENSGSN